VNISRKEREIALANNMNCHEGHLGGYIKASPLPALSGLRIDHGDPATYSPTLWCWAYETLGVRSVLDVGCGEGHCAGFFRNLGCRVLGVDGSVQARQDSVISEFHVVHDFVNGPYATEKEFDLVWACEFVEHVEEQYIGNFLTTFRSSRKFIMLTYAPPGQRGWHHVNCQMESYWIDKLSRIAFTFDPDLTAESRSVAEPGHYRRKGLIFVRGKSPENIRD
jgi:SAM-dependent methyltransferase